VEPGLLGDAGVPGEEGDLNPIGDAELVEHTTVSRTLKHLL
jgi:hypothetical protein